MFESVRDSRKSSPRKKKGRKRKKVNWWNAHDRETEGVWVSENRNLTEVSGGGGQWRKGVQRGS